MNERDFFRKKDGRSYRYNPLWLRWRSLGRPCRPAGFPQAGAFVLWMGEKRKEFFEKRPECFLVDCFTGKRDINVIFTLSIWYQFVMEQKK